MHFDQAKALHATVGDVAGEATALGDLAILRAEQGDMVEAIAMWEQSRDMSGSVSDKVGLRRHLRNLSIAYAQVGRSEDEALAQKALSKLDE